MSKKDYIALAEALYKIKPDRRNIDPDYMEPEVVERVYGQEMFYPRVVEAIAGVLRADNSAFQWDRFIEACETGKTKGMKQVSK